MVDVTVTNSKVHGLGVFVMRDFEKDEIILEINDTRVVDVENPLSAELGEFDYHCDYLAGGKIVLMQFPERHINSSCDPSAFVKTINGNRQVVAKRKLKAGDEITYDYIIDCHGGDVWQCNCGSSRCRGTIVSSFFELPLHWQLEYLPFLNPWFIVEHQKEVNILHEHMEKLASAIRLRETQKHEEARELLFELHAKFPNDPQVNYQCAWIHDLLGLEREAITFYESAIQAGLSGDDLQSALLGMGSTYRCIGEYQKAKETFLRALELFPEKYEFKVFLAMTYYNLSEHSKAMELLLISLVETSKDEGILSYDRAIRFYADKLDETW